MRNAQGLSSERYEAIRRLVEKDEARIFWFHFRRMATSDLIKKLGTFDGVSSHLSLLSTAFLPFLLYSPSFLRVLSVAVERVWREGTRQARPANSRSRKKGKLVVYTLWTTYEGIKEREKKEILIAAKWQGAPSWKDPTPLSNVFHTKRLHAKHFAAICRRIWGDCRGMEIKKEDLSLSFGGEINARRKTRLVEIKREIFLFSFFFFFLRTIPDNQYIRFYTLLCIICISLCTYIRVHNT